MKRDLELHLVKWKNELDRRPILLRGARQVGKTFLVRSFAEANFTDLVEINFELEPEYIETFQSLNPFKILENLSLIKKKEFRPGSTILFLDEIQICPEAIKALRYFYEKMPDLHVIAAGSLVDFALEEKTISIPVGRIQYLYVKPISFLEFLSAIEEEKLRSFIENISIKEKIDTVVHNRLLELVRLYSVIGGMPAVVKRYIETNSLASLEPIQALIHQTYRDDFGKYASYANLKYLSQLYLAAPRLIAQNFKYSKVSRDVASRELKNALNLLVKAGVLHRVYSCSASGLPFEATVREGTFKILFLDIGLAQKALGIASEIFSSEEYISLNRGAISEQFVGQELLAYLPPWDDSRLFFWNRHKHNSSAEVDYLTSVQGKVVPIEVKSGSTGKLRSLKILMDEEKISLGVRISEQPFQVDRNIVSIPFYCVSQIEKFVAELPIGS